MAEPPRAIACRAPVLTTQRGRQFSIFRDLERIVSRSRIGPRPIDATVVRRCHTRGSNGSQFHPRVQLDLADKYRPFLDDDNGRRALLESGVCLSIPD